MTLHYKSVMLIWNLCIFRLIISDSNVFIYFFYLCVFIICNFFIVSFFFSILFTAGIINPSILYIYITPSKGLAIFPSSLPPSFSLFFPPSFPSLLFSFLPLLTFSFIRYYFQHPGMRSVTNKHNII